MGWIITIVVGVVVLGVLIAVVQEKARTAKTSELMTGREDAEVLVGDDGSYVMLDFDRHVIGLGGRFGGAEASFKDIMTVEVIENGAVLTQTNRGSQALGAAVGGLALGGVGVLVGGLSASSRAKTNIDSIVLRIHLASRQIPSQDVQVVKSPTKKGWDRNGGVGRMAIEKSNRFHSLVLQAMRLAAEGTEPKVLEAPVQPALLAAGVPATGVDDGMMAPQSNEELRRRMDALKAKMSKS